jgi:hypothetical protein
MLSFKWYSLRSIEQISHKLPTWFLLPLILLIAKMLPCNVNNLGVFFYRMVV